MHDRDQGPPLVAVWRYAPVILVWNVSVNVKESLRHTKDN